MTLVRIGPILILSNGSGQPWTTVSVSHERGKFYEKGVQEKSSLTDEAFDSKGLDLHVDQQTAVRLHEGRRQGNAGLGMGQFYDPSGYTVDQTDTEREKT